MRRLPMADWRSNKPAGWSRRSLRSSQIAV
jgi:hypothetical protein